MTTYLVTGGGGFIGSALVRALLDRGDRARVLDNFTTGRRSNLAEVLDRIDLHEGDVADLSTVKQAATGVDYVLHQAALPSVQRSIEDPVAANRTNVLGTLAVLEAARCARVRRVVYAASSSAYGETPTLPKIETMLPQPLSPYAVTKLAGEHYAAAYTRCFGLETVALRYFNVFGPRQDPTSHYSAVIPKFITSYLRGDPPIVHGDGRQTRDFCYVDNVVDANLRACRADGVAGETFNVACGDRIDLLGVLNLLTDIAGRRLEPHFEPARTGDIRDSLASIEKARRMLGYEPLVRFAEGLRRTFEWFRANGGGS